MSMAARFEEQIDKIAKEPEYSSSRKRGTLFHHLLKYQNQKQLPKQALVREVFALFEAGSENTANACYVGTYYALKNHSIHKRLFEELCEAWSDEDKPMPYTALEKLPYLTAFIKETLRFSSGPIHPIPRVVGPTEHTICGLKIPPGTIVGMSRLFLYMDPSVFPEPYNFNPDRWLGENPTEMMLDVDLFDREPRLCLGSQYARATTKLMTQIHSFSKPSMVRTISHFRKHLSQTRYEVCRLWRYN
ncbi:hypothetical protein GYMLUDRAFT_699898 [Collybiopsis luxurians FD-317 M1]|uniref:Cytochrome P450 n=1 Tax=Collybiopsis luxurians FD-317 M1 TaxID=944289 RepID=A0A0D0CIS1_9AGAR|nr:hypothetical protein GYMLUDRAFT_699898 [Collybiopsis luxurians FD-317 M1]